MKCYFLLRNNKETGPFMLEEVITQSLKHSDLVWVEGESVGWKFPAEIEALQPFVTEKNLPAENESETAKGINMSKGIFVALPRQLSCKNDLAGKDSIELKTRFSQPIDAHKEKFETAKKPASFSFPETFSKPHSALWIGCVFAGLIVSAVIIKKIITDYNENATAMATASALPVHDMDNLKSLQEADLYRNALTTEVVPVDTITMKPVIKTRAKINLKKLVRIDANDYRAGLFGGIKNLRLLVSNKSSFVLDKVQIELNYLKPNGDIIKTENLTMNSVSPKSSKSFSVSSQNRGVKVSYRITAIQSKQSLANLINL